MIEKKLFEALEPLLDQVDAIEKKVDAIKPVPGPAGEQGQPGRDGADADPLEVAKRLADDETFRAVIKGDTGEPGKDGENGKDADPVEVAKALVEAHADVLRGLPGEPGKDGAPGEKGADGAPGRDGEDANPDDVAARLIDKHLDAIRGPVGPAGRDGMDGVSLKAVNLYADTKQIGIELTDGQEALLDLPVGEPGKDGADGINGIGFDAKAWVPGIHREKTWVVADLGRIYRAKCDTAGVPGKSDDWERIGPWGMRWTGVKKADYPYEDGDLYIDDGTTFMWFGGKGHMVAKRGAPGAKGEAGKDGKDAPTFLEGAFTLKGAVFVMSDGSVVEAPIEGLKEAIEDAARRKAFDVWEESFRQIEREGGTPTRSFRGQLIQGDSYSKGDIVVFNKSMWIARKANKGDPTNQDDWRHMFSGGGGGGGGGGLVQLSNVLVNANLDMGGRSIIGLASPRPGLTGAGDAVNRAYVDSLSGIHSYSLTDTDAFNARPGATDADKFRGLYTGAAVPAMGDLITVGYNKLATDNAKAGIYRWDGTTFQRVVNFAAGFGGGGGDTFQITSNGAAAAAPTATDLAGVLNASAATLLPAGTKLKNGDIVISTGGAAANAKYNGAAIYNGTTWVQLAGQADTSRFIEGFVKALVSDADPAGAGHPTGSVEFVTEAGKQQIKALDNAGNWQLVYDRDEIGQAIAASRSFKGTVVEAGGTQIGSVTLDTLPAESTLNAGQLATYWTWTGTDGHTVGATEIGGAASAINGSVLSPGDWIQVANIGTTAAPIYRYVVIHGDTLSAARAAKLFGHNVWSDGAWETGSIVRYQATPTDPVRYYKATANVVAGDPAPGAAVVAPATNPWANISPQVALQDLAGIDLITTPPSNGDVLQYNLATTNWEPHTLFTPITFFGTRDIDPLRMNLAGTFGMDTDVVPAATMPTAGDMYISTQTGTIWVFAGADVTGTMRGPYPTSATQTALDIVNAALADLTDVDVTTTAPARGQTLLWNDTTSKWEPGTPATTLGSLTDVTEAPAPQAGNILIADGLGAWSEQANPSYSKAETDALISRLVLGLEHDIAVFSIQNTPPAVKNEGDAYIIGTAPTGDWALHANDVAFWDGNAWIYAAPKNNETHLVEDQTGLFSWNGTRWVKISSTSAAGGASQQNGVGEILPWMADIIPPAYLPCEGQIVAISAYPDLFSVIGSKYNSGTGADGISTFALPDLRGYFLRGGGNNSDGTHNVTAIGGKQTQSTALPVNPFRVDGTTSNNGTHAHDFQLKRVGSQGSGKNDYNPGGDQVGPIERTFDAGAHTHTFGAQVTGGDVETRPASVAVRWIIRVTPIDGGAVGPRGPAGAGVPAITAADEGKSIRVVTGTAVWATTRDLPTVPPGGGEILKWNPATSVWEPKFSPVGITRDQTYADIENNRITTLEGHGWFNSTGYLVLQFFGADHTTKVPIDNTFSIISRETTNDHSFSDATTTTVTSDFRGFDFLNNDIQVGRYWVANDTYAWIKVEVDTSYIQKNAMCPIKVDWKYKTDRDTFATGGMLLHMKTGINLGRIQIAATVSWTPHFRRKIETYW
ncbi:MAG: tail fiber protein [Pseudomonadales bacterium]